MKRRNFLNQSLSVVGAIAAGELSFSHHLQAAVAASQDRVKWGYIGKEGPQNWGDLAPKYQLCQAGGQQSPINLPQVTNTDLPDLQITSQQVALRIENDGHTIRVKTDRGNSVTFNGNSYDLIEFHFHHPSEHRVANQSYPMEVHLVHRSQAGDYAVLGVFMQEGRNNATLKPIWEVMPLEIAPEAPISGIRLEISALLPTEQSTYRYFGSLTTPPCSEQVKWIIFQEPIKISKSQIEQFAQIFPLNARPIQALNHRLLFFGI